MLRDASADMADMILVHPDFAPAMRRYAVEYTRWRESLGLLNKVVANAARLRILENIVYLHTVDFDSEGQPGPSFERISQLSSSTDDIGARAVRTLLRLAQISGLVLSRRDVEDGRLSVYQPTDVLMSYAKDYALVTLRPLDYMFPQLKISEQMETDPTYFSYVTLAFGRVYLKMGLRTPRTSDPFRDLMRLEGALPILLTVLDGYFQGHDIPIAPEFTRRFHVSQSQVRAVLKIAESLGLIRTASRGRLIDAAPLETALFAAYARFLAFAAQTGFGVEAPSIG